MVKIKKFPPHFDPILHVSEATALVSSPLMICKHSFFPFIEYSDGWTRYAKKGVKGKPKTRPIMYASRRDSCIYSHYRGLLSKGYEEELASRGIGSCILAYRRIPRVNAKGNKSNIHFAGDAFSEISKLGDCLVYALDISKFFDSLSHGLLKQAWMKILGFETMPDDHYKVFRNMTRYAKVNREKLYEALGFIGQRPSGGSKSIGYLVPEIPLKVCSGSDFRKRVVPLIETNQNQYGIPQGSPMSDILANAYLLEFDSAMCSQMNTVGGSYRRYSDDILLIVPGHQDDSQTRLAQVERLLAKSGDQISIQPTKTTVHKFFHSKGSGQIKCLRILGTTGKNGLEYLGFRFDGQKVFIRDSTRSRLQRKMTYAVRSAVRRLCISNPGRGRAELKRLFDGNLVLSQFYKIRDYEKELRNPNKWTFWTYLIRAQDAFGDKGKPIGRQVRNFRRSILHKASRIIDDTTAVP